MLTKKHDAFDYTNAVGKRENGELVGVVGPDGSPLNTMGLKAMKYDQHPLSSGDVYIPDAPEGALICLIRSEGGGWRFRDDGEDPTSTMGWPMEAGETLVYDADMDGNDLRMVAQVDDVIVNFLFYGRPEEEAE